MYTHKQVNCATLCLHSFPPVICLSWFLLTMIYGGNEDCTLKWLRLCWIQISLTHWQLQQWSFSNPCVDRRRRLTSVMCWQSTQCGPICKHKRSMTVGAVLTLQTTDLHLLDQVKKPHRLVEASHRLSCVVLCDMTQITEPRSLWTL